MAVIETKNHIKNRLSLALSVEKGSIVDFETTGLLHQNEHEIVGFGHITSSRLVLLGRKAREKGRFYSEVRRIMRELPMPYYAYNAAFDRGIMEIELGIHVNPKRFICLQDPWRSKAEKRRMKWPKLDELISEPAEYFNEPRVRGEDVPRLWKEFLREGTDSPIRKIMQHNLSDLLREAVLLLLHPRLYRL